MLIEFRVENHRSLRDEQAFSLEAASIGDAADSRPRNVKGHGEPLLPAAVIYGANASGKSNVLSALEFMRDAVMFSHRIWEPEEGIPRTAFAWGAERSETSMFEVTFLVEETKYVYGFVVDNDVVKEEWLYSWPKKRKQTWLEREDQQFKFGDHLSGPNEAVKEVTRANALFLSAAAQHGHAQLSPLYAWFRGIISMNVSGRISRRPSTRYLQRIFFSRDEKEPLDSLNDEEDDAVAERIRLLLKSADFGIVDIKAIGEGEAERRFPRRRIQLQHQFDDENSWLDFEEESEGTKTLLRLAPLVFRVLDSGGILLIDELESSLHPLLGSVILQMFNCPQTNPRNAQLLFTTHDTNLLGTTLGEPPLRRDQIWFTEKDKEGASILYPLTDYKPRKAENLERGYLQGRYGAIPFLGNIERITE